MSPLAPWRVEWLRLVRTRRLLALLVVFAAFGLTEPLLAKYLGSLLDKAGSSGGQHLTIIVPPPKPADGISGYQKNAMQIGLVVSVVVAAYACAVDANPALSVFYRSRARSFSALILPRAVVAAGAVVGAYLAGMLCAWYETATLIGAPRVTAVVHSMVAGSAFLVFAVAVTALAGTIARNALGTAGVSLLILLVCPLVGMIPAISRWMPSVLASASYSADYAPQALLVTCVACAGLLALAAMLGERREVG